MTCGVNTRDVPYERFSASASRLNRRGVRAESGKGYLTLGEIDAGQIFASVTVLSSSLPIGRPHRVQISLHRE
jgi:hypothetical protein